jgi:hypothetical protein
MSPLKEQANLFGGETSAPDVVAINARCALRTRDGHRIVIVAGMPVAHFAVGDRAAEGYAMVTLVEQGWADQIDVARAFGCSARRVRRSQRRFESGGLAALARSMGWPKGRARLRAPRIRMVNELRAQGVSQRAIAERLGVSEKAVRKLLRRLGWKPPPAVEQGELPLESADPNLSASTVTSTSPMAATPENPAFEAACAKPEPPTPASPSADPNLSAMAVDPRGEEPTTPSFDIDPANRQVDRVLAALGLLDDATPLFRPGAHVAHAGALLAIPALIDSGVVDIARDVYGSIGPAFYGLRTTMVAMVLMALMRIKRAEGLKERSPENLGRLLGLDRAPEVKTLRRKLAQLAAYGRGTELGRALAERRVQSRGHAMGFLYVDGHVRAYHGKHDIPKGYNTRQRLCMPATTDYWINDAEGEPLFVVTSEANRQLMTMLPAVLLEVRSLVGERRVTMVFDRGGWSPKLFLKIIRDHFDILTYRKGRFRRLARRCFSIREATIEGRAVRYDLADQEVRFLKGKLRLRQVTRLCDDGQHQTPVITSRRDLPALEVAYRMFERWRQENFFKYLREEYALDALVDYGVQPADSNRMVPNPERKALDAQLRHARAELSELAAKLGVEALRNHEHLRRTMRGFKIANATLSKPMLALLDRIARLEKRRAQMPTNVPVQQAVEGQVVKLAVERKHLTNLIKMVAFQAETELARLLAPHYRRAADEGRTLITSALATSGDIDVTDTELRVSLQPLSSPHRTKALTALCATLNETPARFPGSELRLYFTVKPEPPSSLAFPGPPASARLPRATKSGHLKRGTCQEV